MSSGSFVRLSMVVAAQLAAQPLLHAAGPLAPADVPEPLRTWIPWVLADAETRTCPRLDGDARNGTFVCGWPGTLELTLDERGGRFSLQIEIYAEGAFALPGRAADGGPGQGEAQPGRWPLDVAVDGRRTPVLAQNGLPHVRLTRGRHTLSGRFSWDSLPEALYVPPEIALVRLQVAGRALPYPQRTPDGRLFLARAEVASDADNLDLTVHRKLIDGVPMLLVTRLTLAISGKSREIVLGRALPDGFLPLELHAPLPVQVRADGHLVVQARPGHFVLELTARNVNAVDSITRPDPQGLWKAGEEAWVFQDAPELRAVSLEGVPAIDPQQTTLPEDWRSLPAFAVELGQAITLVTRQRGDAEPQPDRLRLARELWLDFDGGGLTARDRITGELASWRLTMAAPAVLGRATMNGQDQFITRMPDGLLGFEVRERHANVEAASRIPRTGSSLSAVSWQHDFEQVSAALHLPPGWRLLHGGGADRVVGSWIGAWSLLALFLLLVTALGVYRLHGVRLGVAAFLALLLSLNEPAAPAWSWLALVVAEALVRVVPDGRLLWVMQRLRALALVVVAAILIPFSIHDLRAAIHPAAEHERGFLSGLVVGGAAAPVQYTQMNAHDSPEYEDVEERLEAAGSKAEPAAEEHLSPRRPGSPAPPKQKRMYAQNVERYDKSVVVQTGPGVPEWTWGSAYFSWNGPVEAGQELRLVLLSPGANGALAFLRQALLLGLVFVLLRRRRLRPVTPAAPPPPATSPAAAPTATPGAADALSLLVLGALSLVVPGRAHAASPAEAEPAPESPTPALLAELRERLLAPPPCAPHCAAIDALHVDATAQALRLRFDVSAEARVALPLPGRDDSWLPTQIRIGGKPAAALYRDDAGTLWVAVDAGTTKIEAEGPWPPRSGFALSLPLRPGHTTATLRGVHLDGLHEDGQVADTLQFQRDESQRPGKLAPDAPGGQAQGLLPLLLVRREIDLGLRFSVTTTVTRAGADGQAIVTEIALLPGEAITSAGLRLSPDGSAVAVNLGPNESSLSWTSTLPITTSLALLAPGADKPFVESWHIDVGPIWHLEVEGIPPLRNIDGGTTRRFSPWPNERLLLNITRPAGAEGQTLTIDKSRLFLTPGPRSTSGTLDLTARTSRGREHVLYLPAGAEVQTLSIGGRSQPIRQRADGERTQLALALSPGQNDVHVAFRHPQGIGLVYRPNTVALGTESTNAELTLSLAGAERWILWITGPRLGPTVFFWSHVLVLLLLGVFLARTGLAPLRFFDWLLLGLGLMQLHFAAALVVAGFFLALGRRGQRAATTQPEWRYNFGQLLWLGWALLVVSFVFLAIKEGLLSSPDMGVAGNGSSESTLHFYTDRIADELPRPVLVSAPILVYRGAMLVWALWLALSILRWSRWAWACLTRDGVWKQSRHHAPQAPR